ncbi:HotDog domain-containing protein [Obelidium mucronatum]|nr:HotDog domain-containing protein [Obelidium mucronatum]
MSKSSIPAGGLSSCEQTLAELLKEYPSVVTVVVQWGDQDIYQHVNNAIYVKYFETGRISYFNLLVEHMGQSKLSMDYRKPVTYPDTLTIGVRVDPKSIKSDRFDQECRIVSHKFECITNEGRATLVCFDHKAKRKIAIPKEFLEGISHLEQLNANPSWNSTSVGFNPKL